jgi:hypothetical protein
MENSFEIFKDGSIYKARNSAGTNDYSGTDATTVINNVFSNVGNNCSITFGPGTYDVQDLTLDLDNATIYFNGAKLNYTGTGSCLTIKNSKNVRFFQPWISLSTSTANTVGLHIRGLWSASFYDLKIEGGSTTSTGVKIETSFTGGNNWGAYVINFLNPDIRMTNGDKAFATAQTSGDTVNVTHLNVYNGYISGSSTSSLNYGFYLDQCLETRSKTSYGVLFQLHSSRSGGLNNIVGKAEKQGKLIFTAALSSPAACLTRRT